MSPALRVRLPITCAHYEPVSASRRCEHYLPNGACTLPHEFMCVEWLKVNAPAAPRPAPLSVTLFESLNATARTPTRALAAPRPTPLQRPLFEPVPNDKSSADASPIETPDA